MEYKEQEIFQLQETVDDATLSFTPTCFDHYLGQTAIKEKLRVYVTACKLRNEALDHLR